MLLRLAYLAVTNTFAALRLLPISNHEKNTEILLLRHQITVLERQLHGARVHFNPHDRAFLAALLTPVSRDVLRRLRLLVRPDTVLRWHRDLMKQRHARTCQPQRPGRPSTIRSIRVLILRLVRENPSWGYRRVDALGVEEVGLSGPGARTVAPTGAYDQRVHGGGVVHVGGPEVEAGGGHLTVVSMIGSLSSAEVAMSGLDSRGEGIQVAT